MNTTSIAEPDILRANTYYWRPAASAPQRRRNEDRHQAEVADYLRALCYSVSRSGDYVIGVRGETEVTFHYCETCKNVCKTLVVTRGGKRSNIAKIA